MIGEFVHQSVRDRTLDTDKPGRKIACGADMASVKHTPICNQVTCPKCLEWQKKLTDAVFAPLSERAEP